jgi:hypothetical protein
VLPTPIVRLTRAVAIGRAFGAAAALPLVDGLVDDPALRDYHLLPSVRGDLLARLGRDAEARREFERAAPLTTNSSERAFLLARAASLPADAAAGPTLAAAFEAFLARPHPGAAVPHRPPPGAAGHGRPLPAHRPPTPLLRTGRVPLQASQRRPHAPRTPRRTRGSDTRLSPGAA